MVGRRDCIPEVQLDLQLNPNFSVLLLPAVGAKSLGNLVVKDLKNNSNASLISTRVCALTASLGCQEQSLNREIVSRTFAAVMCDDEAPCSVNTVQLPEKPRMLSTLNQYNSTFKFFGTSCPEFFR